jgi:hypothetical protein
VSFYRCPQEKQAEKALKKPILSLKKRFKNVEKPLKTGCFSLTQEGKGNVRVSEGRLREHREAACVSLVFACHIPPAVLKYPSGHPRAKKTLRITNYALRIFFVEGL